MSLTRRLRSWKVTLNGIERISNAKFQCMMERVRPGLFFGDIYDAADRDSYRENGVDAVVKLSGSRPNSGYPEDVEVFDHAMPDSDENTREEFSEAVNRVQDLVEDGGTVFVHCAAGQSRSVCVAAAVHAFLDDEDFEYGLQRIRELRDVNPHRQLVRNGRKTVDGAYWL